MGKQGARSLTDGSSCPLPTWASSAARAVLTALHDPRGATHMAFQMSRAPGTVRYGGPGKGQSFSAPGCGPGTGSFTTGYEQLLGQSVSLAHVGGQCARPPSAVRLRKLTLAD